MKILNLFAGLGGNRSAWGDSHKVVAVEKNKAIARIYKRRFPKDRVVVKDAIEILMNKFPLFDFIWISPECKTHCKLIRFRIQRKFEKGYDEDIPLPDLNTLYGSILFLRHYFNGYFVVENVKGYYVPLIEPTVTLGRHYFWCNFPVPEKKFTGKEYSNNMKEMAAVKGFDLKLFNDPRINNNSFRKDGAIRDMVNPKISAYIMECLLNHKKNSDENNQSHFPMRVNNEN